MVQQVFLGVLMTLMVLVVSVKTHRVNLLLLVNHANPFGNC